MFDAKTPNWVDRMTYWFNRATHQILLVSVGSWVVEDNYLVRFDDNYLDRLSVSNR